MVEVFFDKKGEGTSLLFQWLRLCFQCRECGFHVCVCGGGGIKILHVARCSQKYILINELK